MTRFPAATWRGPVPNHGGTMGPVRGLVLHIQEGSEAGTDAWFHNPASKVSAHFGNPKSGPLDQWVEVGTVAWAEVDGNSNWISVENEGHSGDSLTASQLENVAQLLAWLYTTQGVPLAISNTPASGTPGLTGHGLGGDAWGGHFDCPGAPILAQRDTIIARAQQLLGGASSTGDDMPLTQQEIQAIAQAVYRYGEESVTVTGAVVKSVPLGNLAHGAWVALNDAAGAVPQMRSQVDNLFHRPAFQPVDLAALEAFILQHQAAGTAAADLAAALVSHLDLKLNSK